MAIVLRLEAPKETSLPIRKAEAVVNPADYRELVFRLALAITGERDGAEDIAQEVLIKLYKANLKKLDNPLAWVRRVTVRHAIHYLKRNRSTTEIPQELQTQENTEQAAAVQAVLKSLDPEQRALLGMAIGQGLAYKEIAEALGIPEGTVGSRLNAAKKEFQRRWQQ